MHPQKSQKPNLNKFNYCSAPLPHGKLPEQIEILSLEVSADGQGGVIFIQLPQGSFIIKPTINIPKEIYYNLVATEMGIKVAKMDFFTVFDPIHNKIFSAIRKYCQNKDECLMTRLRIKFDNLFYAIIQYIPSISFQHIGKQRFSKMILQTQKLHQLGVCLGFDMLINNNDRFQFLLGGEGNINNILIQVPEAYRHDLKLMRDRNDLRLEFGCFVFIDNQGNMCDVANPNVLVNIKFYMDKVGGFLEQALAYLLEDNIETSKFLENRSLKKFLTHIQLYTHYKLTPTQIKQVILGIRDTIDIFINCQKTKKLSQILQQVYQMSNRITCLQKEWKSQLSTINMNYCEMLVERVGPIMKMHYQEVVRLRDQRRGKQGI